jgi:hypothetical protein
MKARSTPSISVVILSWNGGNYLKKCVKSVYESNYPKDLLEVIVVDNGSTDGSAKLVKRLYQQIELIETNKNLGFCEGNNVGIRQARGDIVILLNNDTIVTGDWIKEILRKAKSPKVGIVGCRLYYPESRIIQSLGNSLKFPGYWEVIGEKEEDKGQFPDIGEVDYVCGAAIAIKRGVLEKIGLLDPRFYAFCEDVDWCYRARKVGYRVVTSNAVVYHHGSTSWNRFLFRKAYLSYRNKMLLIMKHYPSGTLLRYLFEYPTKSLGYSLHRLLEGESIFRKSSRTRENVLLQAPETALFRIVLFFMIFLISLAIGSKKLREAVGKYV